MKVFEQSTMLLQSLLFLWANLAESLSDHKFVNLVSKWESSQMQLTCTALILQDFGQDQGTVFCLCCTAMNGIVSFGSCSFLFLLY